MNKKIILGTVMSLLIVATLVSAFSLSLPISHVEIESRNGIDTTANIYFSNGLFDYGEVSVSQWRATTNDGILDTVMVVSEFENGEETKVTVNNRGEVCVWDDDFSKKKCVKKPKNQHR